MNIYFDPNCLAETKERLFPASKNRSRRIRKKLIKRFGGEFRKEPAIFQIGDKFIAHPIYQKELMRNETQCKIMAGKL